MFRGSAPAKIDDKGRLKIPTDFRRLLEEEEKVAMARWSEHCRMRQEIGAVAPGPASVPDPSLGLLELPDPFEEVQGG